MNHYYDTWTRWLADIYNLIYLINLIWLIYDLIAHFLSSSFIHLRSVGERNGKLGDGDVTARLRGPVMTSLKHGAHLHEAIGRVHRFWWTHSDCIVAFFFSIVSLPTSLPPSTPPPPPPPPLPPASSLPTTVSVFNSLIRAGWLKEIDWAREVFGDGWPR